jgi:hypothetical protein
MAATSECADVAANLPVCVTYGNCQAEALREVLCASPAFAAQYRIPKIPPVHAITAAELSELQELLAGASLIIAQPISVGYRGLALGTDEIIAAAPRGCRILRFPVLFFGPLFPFQAYVHVTGRNFVNAPITGNYHDLRIISCAARGMEPEAALDWLQSYVPETYRLREFAAGVAANLRARERDLEIPVLDRFTASPIAEVSSFFTINHPTRQTLRYVSEGVHRALEIPFEDTGEAEPLDVIRTPIEDPVLNALDLPGTGTDEWVVDGNRVSMETVVAAHLDFYRQRPDVLDAALKEHGARLAILKLIDTGSANAGAKVG